MNASLERTKEAFEKRKSNFDDPGATKMWFGKHRGKRLDQLDASYRQSLWKTSPFPHLVGMVCHPTSVFEDDNLANCA